MTLINVFNELELLLSDMAFGGLGNIQPITLKKFEQLKQWLHELNMIEGIYRIDKLVQACHEYHLGIVSIENLVSCFCELEIYEKQILMRISS